MKKSYTPLLTLLIGIFSFASFAQNLPTESIAEGDEYLFEKNDDQRPCITVQEYERIDRQCAENRMSLGLGTGGQRNSLTTSLIWPIRPAAGFTDCGYHFIGAYVDQNIAANAITDFNCNANTYDGHHGTDIAIWPYGFYKMEKNQVEVIAAAPGTIIYRSDGYFDRNCASNSDTANAIIIQHTDGSQALYWHMKKNSVTQKVVGQTVVAGEYLGIVGSSGSSSGPHLHFEVRTGSLSATYNDPYLGNCNTLNANSWWAVQRPHDEPAVIKVSVNTTDLVMPGCPTTETPNESNVFSIPFQGSGLAPGYAKFYIFLRDATVGSIVDLKILNPNGTTFNSWTYNVTTAYKASYWGWSKKLPTIAGAYAFQSTYNGVICSKSFEITGPLIANAGNDTSDCGSGQVQIGGNPSASEGIPPYTYAWSPAAGLDNPIASNPNASPTSTTIYMLTVTDFIGVTATDQVTVSANCNVNISGAVTTEQGTPIPTVTVNLTGSGVQTDVTANDGLYGFEVANDGSYTLTPSKNNDVATFNGISTLDILFIQKQILAIQTLSSPYKIIAADVNASSSITTLDVVLMRSIILATNPTFPNGKLWIFLNSDFVFADPQNPFPFDGARTYGSISQSYTNQNFIGIKLGDVNDSWNPNTPKLSAVGEVQFQIDEHIVMPQDEVIIPVKVRAFNSVTGYQFTVSWNPEVLSILEVTNKSLIGNYGMQKINEGYLTTSWYDEMTKDITLDDEAVVFELKFKAIGATGTQSAIKIGSEITPSEAYNEDLDLLNIVPTNGMVKVGDDSPIVNQQSSIINLHVQPNPFTNTTNIIFTIPQNEAVSIVIYDLLGKEIKYLKAKYKVGEHKIEWTGDDDTGRFLSNGIYHVRMNAGDTSWSKKVVMMK